MKEDKKKQNPIKSCNRFSIFGAFVSVRWARGPVNLLQFLYVYLNVSRCEASAARLACDEF